MNRLYRSDTDRVIAGVCGGLGQYLRIDPLILRILFVLLAMANGVGLIVYLMLWIFVPVAHIAYDSQEEMVRHNVDELRAQVRTWGQSAQEALRGKGLATGETTGQTDHRLLIIGALLVGIGLIILLDNFGLLWWLRVVNLWPLLLIALGAAILLNNLKGKR